MKAKLAGLASNDSDLNLKSRGRADSVLGNRMDELRDY